MAKKYSITVRMFDIPSEDQIHGAFQHIVDMPHEDYANLMEVLCDMAQNPDEDLIAWPEWIGDLRGEGGQALANMSKRNLEDHLLHGACKKIPQMLRELDIWDQTQGEATFEYDADDWLLEGEQLTKPFSIRLFMMAYTGVFEVLGIETSGSNLPKP